MYPYAIHVCKILARCFGAKSNAHSQLLRGVPRCRYLGVEEGEFLQFAPMTIPWTPADSPSPRLFSNPCLREIGRLSKDDKVISNSQRYLATRALFPGKINFSLSPLPLSSHSLSLSLHFVLFYSIKVTVVTNFSVLHWHWRIICWKY